MLNANGSCEPNQEIVVLIATMHTQEGHAPTCCSLPTAHGRAIVKILIGDFLTTRVGQAPGSKTSFG